ncbi:MAG: BACON domain-containing carbohydrate-binding protein, partial [Candidatus Krumholzibacteriia bacterium]
MKNAGSGTMNWSQSDNASWLTVSPPSGSLGAGQSASITASYSANSGCDQRVGTITVTASGAQGSPKSVTVTQAPGGSPVLSVTPVNRSVPSSSGSTTFTVKNDGCATMSWSQSDDASWLTVSPPSGSLGAGQSATLTASYDENTGAGRSCSITVTAPDAVGSPKVVTVEQAGSDMPVLSVTPENQIVGATSGSTTFTVQNEGSGTMNWSQSDNASWLTVSPSSGSLDAGQSATLTATYQANSGCNQRVGTITVTAAGAQGSPKSVTVTQAPGGSPVLSVTPNNRNVPSSSGSTTFTVKNDGCGTMSWTASDNASWLTVSPPSGSLNAGQSATLTASYGPSSGCDDRVGTITVTAPGSQGSPKSVTVTQASGGSPILSVTPSNRHVPSSSGSTTFTVKNDGCGTMSWSQSDNASWLTVSPPNGSLGAGQSTTLTANYQANTACDERVGTITVTAPGAQGTPKSATVTQAPGGGPILSVTPNNRNVSSSSGSTTFTVKNDGCGTMNWSQSDDASWLTVSPPSGSLGAGQSATITASYSANSGCDQRVGTITVTASGAQGNPKSVTVTQAPGGGPILSATPNNRDVPYTSGSTTFTVRNDGCGTMNWTATDNASWLSVSPSSGSLGAGQSATLTASYSANQANVQRIATITVQAPGATGSPKSVTVTQAPNPVETAYIEYRMNTSNTFTYTTNIPDSYLEDLVLRIDSDCSIVPRTVCCSSITYAIRCDPHSGWPTRDAEFWLEGLVIGPSTSSI